MRVASDDESHRIAQLANFVGPSSGGMKTAVEALGRGYAAAGAARMLVVPGPVDERRRTPWGDVVSVRAPRVGGGYRVIVEPWRVIELLEDFEPTSIEVSDKSTMVPVAAWARRREIATVLFSHERLDAMIGLRTGWPGALAVPVSLLNRVVVRPFDRIVTTSRFAAEELDEAARAVATPIELIPLGVDLETFRPPDGRCWVRDVDGTRPGCEPLRLIHVGRLSREKSPALAVATAVELHRQGIAVSLDVVGDGPDLAELRREARGAPVHFHGHVADRAALATLIGHADVALSVCPGETFGLAVLEALACGTPVVTADVGGARELVDPFCGAWAAPSAAALADAVGDLARRPRDVTRRAARHRAEQFPWSATVAAMLDLHARVAEESGALVGGLRDRTA